MAAWDRGYTLFRQVKEFFNKSPICFGRKVCLFSHMNPVPRAEDDQARMALLSPRSRIHLWLLRESSPIPGWETISDLCLGEEADPPVRDGDEDISMCGSDVSCIHWSDTTSPRNKYTQTEMPGYQETAVQCELVTQPMMGGGLLVPSTGGTVGETTTRPDEVAEMAPAMYGGESHAANPNPMQDGVYHFPDISDEVITEEWNALGITVTAVASGEQRLIRLSGPLTWEGRAGL